MAQPLNFQKTKDALDKILAQAKESVKVLEALQKEGMARARSMMHLPSKDQAQKMTNDKIVASLRKLGLATRSEVRDLEKKVEELASELRGQISQVSKMAKKTSGQQQTKNPEGPARTS
jgi:small-conductance mechanosensitive channel